MTAAAPGQILELGTLSWGSDGGGDRALPVAGSDSLRFVGEPVGCQRQTLLESDEEIEGHDLAG